MPVVQSHVIEFIAAADNDRSKIKIAEIAECSPFMVVMRVPQNQHVISEFTDPLMEFGAQQPDHCGQVFCIEFAPGK